MNLHRIARRGDTDQAFDGYTEEPLFQAQASSFDDSSSDGATQRRRGISCDPRIEMPRRRVIHMYEDRWLVGKGTVDGWKGTPIRTNYNMKRCNHLMALLTPAEACVGDPGIPVYVQAQYFKEATNSFTDSQNDPFWNVFIAIPEPVSDGSFFRDENNRLYRVRQNYIPLEELRIAQSDMLDADALQTITVITSTYDRVTDIETSVSVDAPAIQFEVSKFFRFRAEIEARNMPGDRTVFVPTGVEIQENSAFTMLGDTWRVVTKQVERDVWALQVRRSSA